MTRGKRGDNSEQQHGFMSRKSTTNVMFALRVLSEKCREGQNELHCVFVNVEKSHDRVPKDELLHCHEWQINW